MVQHSIYMYKIDVGRLYPVPVRMGVLYFEFAAIQAIHCSHNVVGSITNINTYKKL